MGGPSQGPNDYLAARMGGKGNSAPADSAAHAFATARR